MKNFFSGLFSGSKPKTSHKFNSGGQLFTPSGNNYSHTLTPKAALDYYLSIAPLFTAVDMIATASGSIDVTVKDRNTDEFVYDHEILKLLRNPSALTSGREFIEQLASFYLLTGNAFVVATGPANRPALEIQIINPTTVNLLAGNDGYLEIIEVHTQGIGSRKFTRKEVDGRFRYFDGADAEIWQLKSFNTGVYAGNLWGMSPLNPIAVELDQYIESSMHNLSLLKRGARPSGALKFGEMLTDEQFQRYQKQVDQFYSGGRNAGRLLLLENAEFQEMSQSNKDMDFAALKSAVTNTIYSSFRIPLPLVNSEFSTYDNLSTSKVNFFDNAVTPLFCKLVEELTAFLMPRYDRSGNLYLSYDPETIEALEPRRVDKVSKLQAAGILTLNELRFIMGYEPVSGGDEIYINSSLIPLSQDVVDPNEMKSLLLSNKLS